MPADLDLVRRLAPPSYLAVFATTRADGSVQCSLVNAGVMDDPASGQPSVAAVVSGNARKLPLLRKAGRAAVTFTKGYEWVAVEGPVHIIGPDDEQVADLPALLRGVFTAAGGTHDNWDEFDRVMSEQRRAAVLIEAARISSHG